MNAQQFRQVFDAALETAAKNVEEEYKVQVPRVFEIEFGGLGYQPSIIDVDEAFNRLYLGEDLYVAIVDTGVLEANHHVTRVWMNVPGYPPKSRFEDTWNQPPGTGPFKQVIVGLMNVNDHLLTYRRFKELNTE